MAYYRRLNWCRDTQVGCFPRSFSSLTLCPSPGGRGNVVARSLSLRERAGVRAIHCYPGKFVFPPKKIRRNMAVPHTPGRHPSLPCQKSRHSRSPLSGNPNVADAGHWPCRVEDAVAVDAQVGCLYTASRITAVPQPFRNRRDAQRGRLSDTALPSRRCHGRRGAPSSTLPCLDSRLKACPCRL